MNPYELENITDKDYLLITIIKEWLKICDEAVDDPYRNWYYVRLQELQIIVNLVDAYPFLYQAILAY